MSSREHIYKIAVEEKKKKKRKEILTASRGSIGNTQIIQITLNIITPPPPPEMCCSRLSHPLCDRGNVAGVVAKKKDGPRQEAGRKEEARHYCPETRYGNSREL